MKLDLMSYVARGENYKLESKVQLHQIHLYKCCHYITRVDSYAAFIIDDFSNSRSLYAHEHKAAVLGLHGSQTALIKTHIAQASLKRYEWYLNDIFNEFNDN